MNKRRLASLFCDPEIRFPKTGTAGILDKTPYCVYNILNHSKGGRIMRKSKRMIALFAAFLFAAALLIPSLFVVLESNHDCTGVDCRICAQVTVCMHLFDGVTPEEVHAALVFRCFVVAICIGILAATRKPHTLIQLKVKLSS